MRAIFLDRDGVINRYPGHKKYVTSLKQFRLLPGVKHALRRLSREGFTLLVISNQAGVGRGIYSQRTLDRITRSMLTRIAAAGGRITHVYYCTHRKELNCRCRKPRPGLLYQAKKDFPKIELEKSFFIGDSIRDVLAAHSAGCKSILVLSGREKLSNRKHWQAQPDFVFKHLSEAAAFILGRK
jgi:D-glycero-D-manno-heptose 1,7-bisphosphate phosphatase